jgi:hypothetical protein
VPYCAGMPGARLAQTPLMVVTTLPLGMYAWLRVELRAVMHMGPFCLTIDHPATHRVEYYATLAEALRRREELERTLDTRRVVRDDTHVGRPC